ncbi:MAG TPA: tetratricopeptide repeat protein [Sphingomicrobium sp.]|nr:tetratricopeptide repeat protein [Sphingomicrobium sp.]
MRALILFVAILFFAAPASAEWWEARTDHFIIYSKSSAQDAKNFAEQLERYDQSLRSLHLIKQDQRLSDARRVKIYRSGRIVDISVLAGDSESGVAGFYIPRMEPVAFVPAREDAARHIELDALKILFHEYYHHFMFRYFAGAYPGWYIEGIAELHSTLRFMPNGAFHVGDAPQARAEELMGKYKSFAHYSIVEMLTSKSKPTGEDFYARYTYGWLLTHYLSFEPTRKGQLLNYLRLVDKGVPLADAATQSFGDLRKLEAEVTAYKNRNRFYGKDVNPANYRPPVIEMRKLAPDEEAIMPVVIRSKAGVTPRTAKGVAGDARSVAARYPTSFPVQLELAEAELDAENYDAAERAADAAIALKPDSAEALYFKGMVLLGKAKSNPGQYAAARSWFARARDADPDHPGPLIGNYLSYSKAGGAIPESAVIGLEEAYRLAPYDGDLRITLARQEIAEKRLDVAKMLLVPLALEPNQSKQARMLDEVVDQIDSNNAGQALVKMDAFIKKQEDDKKKSD